jgi:O-antigen/teichoic acid export membrane protein
MIIVTPILLKYLGVENYGTWILINSIISSLALFNFGINDIIIKYISKANSTNDLKSIKSIFSTIFTFQLFIIVLIYLISLCIIEFILPGFNFSNTVNLLVIAIPLFFIKQLEQLIYAFFKAHEEYGKVFSLSLLSKISFFLTQSLVAIYTESIFDVFKYSLIISFVIYIIELFYIKYSYTYICFINCVSIEKIKLIFNFGMWNWFASLVSILIVHIDKWIVSSILGLAIFTYYSLGILIFNQLHTIISSSISWIFPRISSKELTIKKQLQLYYNLVIFVFIISLFISLILVKINFLFELWLGVNIYSHSKIYINQFLLMLPIYTLTIVSYYYILGLGLVKKKFIIDIQVLILKIIIIIMGIFILDTEMWPLLFLIFLIFQIISYVMILYKEIKINLYFMFFILLSQLIIIFIRLLQW